MNTQVTTLSSFLAGKQESLWGFVVRKPHFLIGLVLVSVLLIQHYYGVQWWGVSEWQQNDLYKQLSGFVLFFYVTAQWRLAYLRFSRRGAEAKNHMGTHKWLGTIAPVFIFFHTTELGHAYQFALWLVFISTILVGLFNFHEMNIRKKWFVVGWTVAHVSLALLLPVMMFYHVYITYIYS